MKILHYILTLCITPCEHGFSIVVKLPNIGSKKTKLFTKSAFCKEFKATKESFLEIV